MIFARLAPRGEDKHGSGAWHAPRGRRKHKGIDFAAYPGTIILAPINGRVTKLGLCYTDGIGGANDPNFQYRYVQITDYEGRAHRVFYVDPLVDPNQTVLEGISDIGTVQDLCKRYEGITNHTHVEIIDKNGKYLNPLDSLV